MIKNLFSNTIFSLLAFSSPYLFCQNTFQNTMGAAGIDKTNAVISVADSAFILAGESCNSVGGNSNALVVKLKSTGQIDWVKTYGSLQDKENLNDIQATTDNGFIAVGERYLANPKGRGENGVLLKTDAAGNMVWWKEFDHEGNEAEGFSLQETADKGFVIAGMMKELANISDPFFALKAELQHLYVLKTDKDGSSQWAGYISGTYASKGLCIKQTSDKGYIITGHIYRPDEAENTKICLLKLDGSGAMQWIKVFDNDGKSEETGITVLPTADNGFMVCGTTFDAGEGNGDIFLFKTNSMGEILWTKTYGGVKTELSKSMCHLPEGGYIISGSTNSFGAGSNDVFLLMVDDRGQVKWFKTYGTGFYEMASGVTCLKDGFALSGFNINSGTVDGFCIRTDKIGNSICFNNYVLKPGLFPLKEVLKNGIKWELSKSNLLVKPANTNANGAEAPDIKSKFLCPQGTDTPK